MKIFVIKSSYHKESSSNYLADQFIKGARESGHEISEFDLKEHKVKPCMGCGYCGIYTVDSGKCSQKDDMDIVWNQMMSSDMVVFVTPLYFWGMAAQLKALVDRFCVFSTELKKKQMKSAMIVAAWNDDDWTMDSIEHHYETLCDYLHFQNQGTMLAKGCGTVEMTRNTVFPYEAYRFGKSLTDSGNNRRNPKNKLKVLFVGNSHTYYNDMPQLFKQICQDNGKNVEVQMIAEPGVPYSWHLEHYIDLRFALMHGEFDYMVMQQAAHPGPSKEDTLRDGETLAKFARKYGVVPLQVVPWAEQDKPEHQKEMYEIYEELAQKIQADLIPTGRIFECITKDHPEISMYYKDGEHASAYGTYAHTLCIYAAIFKEKVYGLKGAYSYESLPISEEAWEKIQETYQLSEQDPENEELRMAAYNSWDKYIVPVMDIEKLRVELDPDKARIICCTIDDQV